MQNLQTCKTCSLLTRTHARTRERKKQKQSLPYAAPYKQCLVSLAWLASIVSTAREPCKWYSRALLVILVGFAHPTCGLFFHNLTALLVETGDIACHTRRDCLLRRLTTDVTWRIKKRIIKNENGMKDRQRVGVRMFTLLMPFTILSALIPRFLLYARVRVCVCVRRLQVLQVCKFYELSSPNIFS